MRRLGLGWLCVMVAGTPLQADDLWRPRPGEVYGPETYCAWNRTGLPANQVTVCQRRDSEAVAGQKVASQRLLAFEADHDKAMKTLARANVAVMCGLRSPEWGSIIQDAITFASDADIRRSNLSDLEVATANIAGQRAYQAAVQATSCASLSGSRDLDELDRLQWKLSGGYH